MIVFLPTCLYHFLAEISEQASELRYVWMSYSVAMVLGVATIATNYFVAGYYDYFWGFYPKAGPVHWLHVVQTCVVVSRGLYICYARQKRCPERDATRLRWCVAALLVYLFAAVDYLCNYGFEFYPPGIIFISISLGIITVAVARYDLMHPLSFAATIAHEMRTPLTTIHATSNGLSRYIPMLVEGYDFAMAHPEFSDAKLGIPAAARQTLLNAPQVINREVRRSSMVIDMMLASATIERMDKSGFALHSMGSCVSEALNQYPFNEGESSLVQANTLPDFRFFGSDSLFTYVLFNLIKNALWAIKSARKGDITISVETDHKRNTLVFTDTGSGIPPHVIARVFDTFFSTKRSNGGTGMVLAFCLTVMESFGGKITCDSVDGQYTTFRLDFPVAES